MTTLRPSRVLSFAGVALATTVFCAPAYADPSTTTPEQGYDAGDSLHPRILAVGGAHYALGTSTSSVYGNPANLPFARVYHFEGMAALSPEARRQSYGAAVADSSTNKIAGAIAGSYSIQDPDGIKRKWTDLRAAIAIPLSEKVAIGFIGRYLRLEQAVGRGPLGSSTASDGSEATPLFSGLTLDVGIAAMPKKGLHLGLVGRNLTVPETSLAPTQIVGAVGYSEEKFGIEGDVMADFHTYGHVTARAMAGGEYLAGDKFPLRLGYRFDSGSNVHAISAGVGYVDKKFSFDLGVRRDIVADHPATFVGVGIRIFVDRSGAQNGSDSGGDSGNGGDPPPDPGQSSTPDAAPDSAPPSQ